MGNDATPDLPARLQIEGNRLRGFLNVLAPACFSFGTVFGLVALFTSAAWRVGAAGGVVLGYGGCCMIGRRLSMRGHSQQAAAFVGYTLMFGCVLIVLLLPSLYPVLAIGPLLAVAFSLPFRRARALSATPLVGWLVTVGCTILGHPEANASTPPWIGRAMIVGGVAAASGLMLMLLEHHSQRMRSDLDELDRARQSAQLLAQGSALLAEAQDLRGGLEQLARLLVPAFADFCHIALVGAPGSGELSVSAGDAEGCSQTTREIHGKGQRVGALRLGARAPRPPLAATLGAELTARIALANENALLLEAALRAAEVREDFLSIAGHELRTPVTALQLQLSGLRIMLQRAAVGDARIVERVNKAERSLTRLASLISELLDASRISAGKLGLQLEELDLAHLANEVVERFVDTSGPLCLSLHAPDPVLGCWDRLRLDQVITNLISNAIKYGEGKPIDLTVETMSGRARLTVRDRGIGIPVDKQGRIFERFERVASGTRYGGLGLGLWIVRQIVDALGGEVRFESEPGQPTTFIVELPLP